MIILATYALFLGTAHVMLAEMQETNNGVTSSFSYHQWLRTTACAGYVTAPGPEADPYDCMQFYFCTSTTTADPSFPLRCDEEYECFDPNATPKMCSTDPLACKIACAGIESLCKFECVSPGDQIADRDDCSLSYHCDAADHHSPTPFPCAEPKPYFNGVECQADKSQCCTCRKDKCTTNGQMIADPNDCHSFYVCLDADGSNNYIPVGPTPCPEGKGFSQILGYCSTLSNDCQDSCKQRR